MIGIVNKPQHLEIKSNDMGCFLAEAGDLNGQCQRT